VFVPIQKTEKFSCLGKGDERRDLGQIRVLARKRRFFCVLNGNY